MSTDQILLHRKGDFETFQKKPVTLLHYTQLIFTFIAGLHLHFIPMLPTGHQIIIMKTLAALSGGERQNLLLNSIH